jgi:hypothetical protein
MFFIPEDLIMKIKQLVGHGQRCGHIAQQPLYRSIVGSGNLHIHEKN